MLLIIIRINMYNFNTLSAKMRLSLRQGTVAIFYSFTVLQFLRYSTKKRYEFHNGRF
jgi:hypothetical protein